MSSQVPKPQGQPHIREGLTKRQTEVLERLEYGVPVKKIAKDMGVTRAAVYQHIDRLRRQGALPEEYTPSGQPGTTPVALPAGRTTFLGPAIAPRESRLVELRSLATADPAYPELIESAISSGDVASLAYELGRADAEGSQDLSKSLAEAALRRLRVLPADDDAAAS